jgi:hypothetical protein
MISSFKSYLIEEEKVVYFTFGRMNPPTIGHEKLMSKLSSASKGNPYRVYLSQSSDPKKNPLNYKSKVKYARKMFPKHARAIMMDNKIKNVFDIATKLYDEGFKKIVMVVGSDRITEFETLLNKYNGKKGRHGLYNFQGIDVVSAGDRDPDAEGASGMSASKMRKAASEDDFPAFAQGLPKTIKNNDAKSIYNDVRKGMGLKEQKEFKNHVQFEPVSAVREAFREGMFKVGEEVVLTRKGIVGKIQVLGTNYVIVESKGEKWRAWPDDISKVDPNYNPMVPEEYKYGMGTPEATKHAKKITPGYEAKQDPDIKDRPGAQPANYHTGLKKSTKIARDRQFKKQANMDDDNPAAYKPAPGDKGAKTKPSKHTKRFKQMFGNG